MFKKGFKLTTIKIYKPMVVLPILTFFIFLFGNFNIIPKKNNQIILSEVFAFQDTAYEKVFISRVIDGDTFELDNKKIIRVIGINAPEDTKNKERLGDIATDFAKETLEGKYVYLEKDVSDKDKYDRYLRNIWLQKPSTQEKEDLEFIKENNFAGKILSLGYAKSMSIEPNIKLKDIYVSIAENAKKDKLGIWSFNTNTKGDF